VAPLLLVLSLLQELQCRGEAARHVERAVALGQAFDMVGAANAYFAAVTSGCVDAAVAAYYLRGLVAAQAAHAQFGSRESLVPVGDVIAEIDARGGTAPGLPQVARVVLQAARAAAQSERPEMTLLLEHAVGLEALQLEAGEPALPVVTAHEAAGDLWLLVRDYAKARRAYVAAEQRIGTTLRVTLGLARAAAGLNDRTSACRHYRDVVQRWGVRPAAPAEIIDARAYLKRPECAG
jgi:hypothetical protein